MRIYRAIDSYIAHLAREGNTEATCKAYRYQLEPFGDLVREETRDPDAGVDAATAEHCELYLDRRAISKKTGKPAAPTTIALCVSVQTQFFAYCISKGWAEAPGPMHGIKRPRLKAPDDVDVVSVSEDQIGRLFAACEAIDEFLTVAVLAYTGVRRSAAARLTWADVDFTQGVARFSEKGRKVNVLPLADELREILYSVALSGQTPNAPADYVIPNRASGQQGLGVAYRSMRGQSRSNKVIYKLIKQVGDRAGVNVHPHSLRAAFAVHYYEQENSGGILALKDLLGHSRAETTEVYLRRRDKARAKETVRGLTWGNVFQPQTLMPPAGFEPALGPPKLPDPLGQKLDQLRARTQPRSKDRASS